MWKVKFTKSDFFKPICACSVCKTTADEFSFRFLVKLVVFFVYVTAVGSIASKKYTWLFPPGRGVVESGWCDPLDDPVEWKWAEACKVFSICVAQIPTRISDLYVNSWQHSTGICYKHFPYWGINVAEVRHLYLRILVRSVGVVDSLKNSSTFENRLQTAARVLCFCYRVPKGERHVILILSCSESLAWRANLSLREWLNFHEELKLGISVTVTSRFSSCTLYKVRQE